VLFRSFRLGGRRRKELYRRRRKGILSSLCTLCKFKETRHAGYRGFGSCALNLGKKCVCCVLCLIQIVAPNAHLPNKKGV
jgi:hypothetical protein